MTDGATNTRVQVIVSDMSILRLRTGRKVYYTAGDGQDLSPLCDGAPVERGPRGHRPDRVYHLGAGPAMLPGLRSF